MLRASLDGIKGRSEALILSAAAGMVSVAAPDGVFSFDVGNEAGLNAGREKGMTMVEAPPEVRAKVSEFLAGDLEAIKAEFTNQYGLKNVDQKLVLAQELIEKWKGLTNGNLTEAQLAGIYWTEVFSKLDAAGYAMD